MADDKTRVIPRPDALLPASPSEPTLVDGQIVFFCPEGHRLVVPAGWAGKRGKCSRCGVPLQIPELAALSPPAPSSPGSGPTHAEPTQSAPAGQQPGGGHPPPGDPPAEDADWNFISGIGSPEADAIPGFDAGAWQAQATGPAAEANPMAVLLARLWAERDHGGIVELHLVGGAVLLPEEFSPRWSGGTHGLFASQAADGSVTLTAVAWDTVQRIVVRQLSAVPDDMFD